MHLPTQTTVGIGAGIEPIGCIARAVVFDAHTDTSVGVLNTVGSAAGGDWPTHQSHPSIHKW